MSEWTFDERDAAAIKQPTTLLVGAASGPLTHDLIARLNAWLPNAHIVTIDGGDHSLPQPTPERLADIVLEARSTRPT